MSKQPNVELPIVTAEHSLGKSTAVKRKRGRPKKETDYGRSEELPDMCAEHGFGKSSESTTVKRKGADPRDKQTQALVGAKGCLKCLQSTAVEKVLLRNEVDTLNLCRWQ